MVGGRHIVPLGGGVMACLFWSGKDSKREESGLKIFSIPIYLIVVQDEPYKIPVAYFSERFSDIIF